MTRCPLTRLHHLLSKEGACCWLCSSFWVTKWCVVSPLFNRCDSLYISSIIKQEKDFFTLQRTLFFFVPVSLPTRYCQCWVMRYSSFGLWTNPCSRLVRYLLVRAPGISAHPLCVEIKIPLGLHFNRNISCLLKHIFKYPCMNEHVAVKHYIR